MLLFDSCSLTVDQVRLCKSFGALMIESNLLRSATSSEGSGVVFPAFCGGESQVIAVCASIHAPPQNTGDYQDRWTIQGLCSFKNHQRCDVFLHTVDMGGWRKSGDQINFQQ